MEESAELIHRITHGETLPMITSCCPGWIKHAEQSYPDFIPNLSSCKSPQQMLGSVIKSYWAEKEGIAPENIFVASVMPCTAKKFECDREEMQAHGHRDVDAVMTTRELGQFIRSYGIDMNKLEPGDTDSPLGTRSTAGKLFAASGGVMEAAIRTACYSLTGKELENLKIPAIRGMKGRKETRLNIGGSELGVAVVSGLGNASVLLDEIRAGRDDLHFIEIMACPGGCINGGGQHLGSNEAAIRSRMESIYDIDRRETLKVCHKNPDIMKLYDDYLGEPLGHRSHELLHTHYEERTVTR
jgi:iron-only hydrogenase group A